MSSIRARVRFLPADREVSVPVGTHLTTAAVRAGVSILHDCDGQGFCGTCRVRVEAGGESLEPIDPRERDQLGEALSEGWRLCCLLRVPGDLDVRLPQAGFAYPLERRPVGRSPVSPTAPCSRAPHPRPRGSGVPVPRPRPRTRI